MHVQTAGATLAALLLIRVPAAAGTKTASFDRDPGWEGFRNRLVPSVCPAVTQDFGFSRTNFAGAAAGEIGGQVWRSTTRAYYAQPIAPRTLNNRLTASGTFALIKSSGGSGVFFGWFNSRARGYLTSPNFSFFAPLVGAVAHPACPVPCRQRHQEPHRQSHQPRSIIGRGPSSVHVREIHVSQ